VRTPLIDRYALARDSSQDGVPMRVSGVDEHARERQLVVVDHEPLTIHLTR